MCAVLAGGCSDGDPLVDGDADVGDGSEADDDSTSDGSGEFVSLIDHAAWTELPASDDPLADHRPDPIVCTIAGWYVEGETLEVDTNYCNYVALRQPSLASISAGRVVRIGFYHFDLTSPEPATAHVAVLVDGQTLWEQEIAIPGDAYVYELDVEAPWTAPVGADVVFHLHNHGQNTWVLQSLAAEQD